MPYVGPAPTPNAPKDLQGGELVLDADNDTTITADTDDQIDIKIAGSDEIKITAAMIAPASADGSALGGTSNEWSDLYLADGAVIGLGADQDVTLTHVADTGILLNSTMAIQFNDASQYINAPSATVLDINATDEVEVNATLMDINANVEISGTATTTGVHTFSATPVFPDGSIALADLDIDGGTDIGAAIVDADLFIVDDGAGGTNRKVTASRIKTYAGLTQAVQSDIEGETNQDTYIPPDLIKHSPGVAKAWMLFEQNGTHSILASYNITSVSDSGSVGHSDIVIATDFSSANYCIAGTAGTGAEGDTPRTIGPQVSDPLAGSLTITTTGDDGSRLDSEFASLAFFGDQ